MGADLPDTVNDAEGIADILRDAGRCAYPPEQVQVLNETQAARPHILAALDTLFRSTDHEFTALVYFSGHGYKESVISKLVTEHTSQLLHSSLRILLDIPLLEIRAVLTYQVPALSRRPFISLNGGKHADVSHLNPPISCSEEKGG